VQKADGSCNTNFKTTKTQEQVLQVFVEFIEGNTTILVSLNSSGSLIFHPISLLQGHASSGTRIINLTTNDDIGLDFQSLSADGVDMGTWWAVRSSWLRPVPSALGHEFTSSSSC